jgi:hypothetical protein
MEKTNPIHRETVDRERPIESRKDEADCYEATPVKKKRTQFHGQPSQISKAGRSSATAPFAKIFVTDEGRQTGFLGGFDDSSAEEWSGSAPEPDSPDRSKPKTGPMPIFGDQDR